MAELESGELKEVTAPVETAPVTEFEKMTDDQLRNEFSRISNETENQPEQTTAPEVVAQPGTTNNAQAAPERTAGEVQQQTSTPQVEQKPIGELTPEQMQDLINKKHIKPEQIAKLYLDLEKDYSRKSQELATLKKPVSNPVVPDTTSQPQPVPEYTNQYEQANQMFLNDLNRDPIGTLSKAINYVMSNSPLADEAKGIKLRNTATELATNPETADFATPEVTEEIKKILQENPEDMNNLDRKLPRLYREAKGRLATKSIKSGVELGRKIEQQNILQKRTAGLEGGNTPPGTPPQYDNNPNTMPLDKLESMINGMMKQGM